MFRSSKLEGAERGEAGWPPADVDRPFLALSVGISVDDVVSGMLDIEGDLPERLFDDSTPSQATLTAPCSDEAQERRRHGAPAVPEEAAAHRRAPAHARRIRQRDRRRIEVGYESVSQFIRDYRRMFGRSSQKDVQEIRNVIERGLGL